MRRAYLSIIAILVIIYWAIGKFMIAAYYNDDENLLGYGVDLTLTNIMAGIKKLNFNNMHFIIDRVDLIFFIVSIITITLIIFYYKKGFKTARYGVHILLCLGMLPFGFFGLVSIIMVLIQFPPDGEWLGEEWPIREALGVMTVLGFYTNIVSMRRHKNSKAPNT